jgi:hypothetical protein
MNVTATALRMRFEQICHSEMERLRRKTSGLPPEQRAEIVAISLEVAHALSAPVEQVLEDGPRGGLDDIVTKLFGIEPR